LYECPDVFAEQMSYLRENGWHAITADQLADLMARRQCPDPKQFVVSFDDGSLDGYTNAAPILESLGMRGTFFATLGNVGAPRTGKFTFDEMRDLVARGHAIGNHSQNHLNLKMQSAQVLYEQIEVAQQRFEGLLGYRPRTFAYPYGRYNDLVIEQVRQSGLELAFTVRRGAREASDAPFISRRIEVLNTDTGARVLARIAPYSEGCRPPTPDLLASLSSTGPWKGANVYASSPWKAQTVSRSWLAVGRTYHYYVRLQNDAQRPGSFGLTRTVTGPSAVSVRYSISGDDVTSALVSGNLTLSLDPWKEALVDVTVTRGKGVPTGTATRIVLRATSATELVDVDVARLVAHY
jgi:peptidoglycan/xylan/chitin deacetylase (PgdA/CDA1 family)